jgi:hypothetical protein
LSFRVLIELPPTRNVWSSALLQVKNGDDRMYLEVIPFILALHFAAFITAIGSVALSYDPRPKDIHAIISYGSLLLFFPAFLIALLQRR